MSNAKSQPPREPDRYGVRAANTSDRCVREGHHDLETACVNCVAAALRAAEAETLERAAQEAREHGDGLSGEELAEAILELKSPVTAPAKCKHGKPGVACDRCPWCWSVKCPGTAAAPAAETLGVCDYCIMAGEPHPRSEECGNWRPAPPSEPAAPAREWSAESHLGAKQDPHPGTGKLLASTRIAPAPLLPRVLAALEYAASYSMEADEHDLIAIAAELRAYIAEREHGDAEILDRKIDSLRKRLSERDEQLAKERTQYREYSKTVEKRIAELEKERDHWRGACIEAMVTGKYPVSPHDDDPQIKSLREAAEYAFHGQAYAEKARQLREADTLLRECEKALLALKKQSAFMSPALHVLIDKLAARAATAKGEGT